MTPLEQARALYPSLSEADQLAILGDMTEGHPGLGRSDAFVDALFPVDSAFSQGYDALVAVVEDAPGPVDDDPYWRDSQHAINAEMGE